MLNTIKEEIRKVSPVSDEECAFFEDKLTYQSISRNVHLVVEGQVSREMAFVIRGCFRMYYVSDGKEINTYFFFENQFVSSFQSLLLNQPSRYYIQAIEDSEVVILKNADIEKAYERSHSWEKFGRKIAESCYLEATARTESFLFLTGQERYLQLLEKYPMIFERVPLYHIASYLGIERESLSRLRKKITTS